MDADWLDASALQSIWDSEQPHIMYCQHGLMFSNIQMSCLVVAVRAGSMSSWEVSGLAAAAASSCCACWPVSRSCVVLPKAGMDCVESSCARLPSLLGV